MNTTTNVVSLDDPTALDPTVAGAKAANLAAARAAGLPALPGVVLTTDWSFTEKAAAVTAWRFLSSNAATKVVVRSSSTGEDGGESSMAGVFESILDVADEAAFLDAVDLVIASAEAAKDAGLVDANMAVLVQPMLDARFGGVLFGADPTTGRTDRLLLAAVAGNPSALVSGEAEGWTAILDRKGKVRDVRSGGDSDRPPVAVVRQLAKLSRDVADTYGGPQDIEWAVDGAGTLHLLQARPITTLPPTTGPVYGPGPVAESFPEALSVLEQDLWLSPMRDGIREALRLSGTMASKELNTRDLVIAIDGMAAADLLALGVDTPAGGIFRKLDPRPPARRLRAAWRVGRLRSAFAGLATDIVHRVDADLMAVPAVADLTNYELIAVLRNGRTELASLHGHEAIAGLLIPEAAGATVTGASLALSAVAQASTEGVGYDEMVERDPVVLALIAPRIGPRPSTDGLAALSSAPIGHGSKDAETPDPAAVAREALRLRVRWMQELTGRAAWELGRRLADVGVLPSAESVRLLTIDELANAAQQRVVPGELAQRSEPDAQRSLPARFRLDGEGKAWAVAAPRGKKRRGGSTNDGVVGVSSGTVTGPVAHAGGEIPAGSVLVVSHLDPRLAAAIPRLGGLVAETGNALSHLAILAREYGVPAIVGVADATQRFSEGQVLAIDGDTGAVEIVAQPEPIVAGDPALLSTGAAS
jgi:phosphohistidine swiveling domain-containing protein